MENSERPSSAETTPSGNLSADELVNSLVGLLETYLKMLKLEVTSNTAAILSATVIVVMFLFFGSFAIFFFSICVAYIIHYIWDIHLLWGFLAIGFFYVLLIVAAVQLRKKIQRVFERVLQALLEK